MDLTALTQTFPLGSGGTGRLVSLPALAAAGFGDTATLPVSLRIVLESVLRNCDGKRITEDDVRRLAQWAPTAERTAEIPFVVARVLLQDFTGVPLLCDLAAMRSALERLGRDPALIEPLVPVDLVIDHSVQVDFTGRERNLPTLGGNGLGGNGTPADPLTLNMQLEFERNRERYEFLKWGMQAFRTFRVIPPGIGICHQVNLEYLAQGVLSRDDLYFPDTLVGTDSHTTMINGLGIVGWGVGHRSRSRHAGSTRVVSDPGRGWGQPQGPPARGRYGHRPRADRYGNAAQGGCRREVRRVSRGRGGGVERSRPGHNCQHGAGIRCDHGLFPGG